jgi:chemotaxis signal transduction protein
VYWVPNLPRHVAGVTNVHGFVVPVLDLALLFEPEAPAPARWLLVLGSEKAAVALQIAALPARRRFQASERCEPAACPPALAPHVRGAYPDAQGGAGPRQWLDFDHRSYFEGGTAFS